MSNLSKKSRIFIRHFLSIATVIVVIGFLGVSFFVNTLQENYEKQQLEVVCQMKVYPKGVDNDTNN